MNRQSDLLRLQSELGGDSSIITKWIYLGGLFSKKKLECIQRSELYLAFPDEFNDIFDSQLRLTAKDIEIFVEKYRSGTAPDIVRRIFKYYQDFFSSPCISCFSKASPLHENSHNMWGLYGAKGEGVALQYRLNDIIDFYDGKDECYAWRLVKYDPSRNPKALFEKYIALKQIQLTNPMAKSGEVMKLLEDFYFIKRNQWEHELEVRVMSIDYLKESETNTSGHHPLNMGIYINKDSDDKATLDVVNHKKIWGKKRIPFIKPCTVILGWGVNLKCFAIKELIKFSLNNKISIIHLSDKIDYDNKSLIPIAINSF